MTPDKTIEPSIVVLHYTAGGEAKNTALWCSKPEAKVSYHLIIARNGDVFQQVPFNRRAWHAGSSSWGGKQNCNDFSIGIGFANWGVLFANPDGTFITYTKSDLPAFSPLLRPLALAHKANPTNVCFWERYTPEQIETAAQIIKVLTTTYPIRAIVGHDDIAPTRKIDPGPAFLRLPLDVATERDSPLVKYCFGQSGVKRERHYWKCSSCSGLPCYLCSMASSASPIDTPTECPFFDDGRDPDWIATNPSEILNEKITP